jgi:hypothetical protein
MSVGLQNIRASLKSAKYRTEISSLRHFIPKIESIGIFALP